MFKLHKNNNSPHSWGKFGLAVISTTADQKKNKIYIRRFKGTDKRDREAKYVDKILSSCPLFPQYCMIKES
jgi:hypothetical protein